MLTEEEIARIRSIRWCIDELFALMHVLETRHDKEDTKMIAWHHTEMVCELLGLIGREEYDQVADLYETYLKSLDAAEKYFVNARENPYQQVTITENPRNSPKFEGSDTEI